MVSLSFVVEVSICVTIATCGVVPVSQIVDVTKKPLKRQTRCRSIHQMQMPQGLVCVEPAARTCSRRWSRRRERSTG